jgi:hypothetical protein
VQASSIRISKTRRRRARRQRQRAWAKSGAIAQRRTDRGWMEPSSGTTPNEKLIGRVSPIAREDAPVRVSSPEFYTPSAELFLHPHDVDEVGEPNQVDRYLYLTNEFLKKFKGGYFTNPIPLIKVKIATNNDNFPPLPSLVFGPPTGSNVVLYDQDY